MDATGKADEGMGAVTAIDEAGGVGRMIGVTLGSSGPLAVAPASGDGERGMPSVCEALSVEAGGRVGAPSTGTIRVGITEAGRGTAGRPLSDAV
jgi:hypothetical protein